jgi:hypothetical protein
MLRTGDYSNLGSYILPPQNIASGRTYWTEQQRIAKADLSYWTIWDALASNSRIQEWIDFTKNMINSSYEKLNMIETTLKDFDLDEKINNGTSQEAPRDIAARKKNLNLIILAYYTHLADHLHQGVDLLIPNWTNLGRFIQSLDLINMGITFWTTEKTNVSKALTYWRKQLVFANNSGNHAWIGFINNMIASLQEKPAMIDKILQNLGMDKKLVQGQSVEAPDAIAARKVSLEETKLTYYTNLISVLEQGRLHSVTGTDRRLEKRREYPEAYYREVRYSLVAGSSCRSSGVRNPSLD